MKITMAEAEYIAAWLKRCRQGFLPFNCVQRTHEELKSSGARFLGKPRKMAPGKREAFGDLAAMSPSPRAFGPQQGRNI